MEASAHGGPPLLRQINSAHVLAALRGAGPLSLSDLATSDFQYGVLLALYWAITTLMVPLALPPEPPPEPLLLLPPHAAASPTAATPATAPTARPATTRASSAPG